ncbi:TerB family tellurite resistance protein [Paremcibacter congregatus]|uniref:tellurite resistance TerB family protein n=1 Tax=Paremcibacter congregatus TaxID=2043170 RepID=UPI0030ED2913
MSILKKISAMLQGPAAGETPDKECEKLAAAALMVEVAAHDGEVSRVERERILHLLEHRLGLSQEEALELFVEALAAQSEANHILGFTRRIKDHFDDAGREHILELMWEVVFADGKEDAYESNLMRRVAGLLYISDLRSGQIRKTVQVRHAD